MRHITKEELGDVFTYVDGSFYWKIKPSSRVNIGDKVGGTDGGGYIRNRIHGRCYSTHRLIFLFFNGYVPEYIDHIDGNRSNNKIENLRECTWSQNQQNSKLRTNNTSGIKGLSYVKRSNKWLARISLNKKVLFYKEYSSKSEAVFELRKERERLHSEFSNHG